MGQLHEHSGTAVASPPRTIDCHQVERFPHTLYFTEQQPRGTIRIPKYSPYSDPFCTAAAAAGLSSPIARTKRPTCAHNLPSRLTQQTRDVASEKLLHFAGPKSFDLFYFLVRKIERKVQVSLWQRGVPLSLECVLVTCT